MKIKRPMLSATCSDITKINYPVIASPKLDGFRCLKLDGKALSRSFKPVANKYVRAFIEQTFPDGIDGELMLADPNANFNEISSALRKHEGRPDFVFFAFDYITDGPFEERLMKLSEVIKEFDHPRLQFVPHQVCNNPEELKIFEEYCLNRGFEGVMIRDPQGPYKQGRSTEKQGWLMKLKRFEDSEAEILGFVEQFHNENKQEVNEIGLRSRSSKKAGMKPADTLGAFVVRDLYSGVEFEIGHGEGLTHALRKEIWDNQEKYKGEIVKYRYQPHGVKEKPRIPVWLGFRAPEDL